MATKAKIFTIYHIPGRKVGCTTNLKKRQKAYPAGTTFEVIETLEGCSEEAAGNREWEWADHYCYPRGGYYPNHWANQTDDQQKSRMGKKGGRSLALQRRKWGPQTPEHRQKIGDPQRGVPRAKHTEAWKTDISKKMTGLTAWVVNAEGPIKVFTTELGSYLSSGYVRGRKL